MNKFNIQKNMMTLMKPDKLDAALQDTLIDLQEHGLTSDLKQKIVSLHFTIILSYQNKNITFRKYCDLVNALMIYLND